MPARGAIDDAIWIKIDPVYRQDGSEAAQIVLRDLGYERSRPAIRKVMQSREVKYEPRQTDVDSLGITRRCINKDCIERFIPTNKQNWYHEAACRESDNLWTKEEILAEEGALLPTTSHMELAKAAFGQKNAAHRKIAALSSMRDYFRAEMDEIVREDPALPFVLPAVPPPAYDPGDPALEREILLLCGDFQLGKWQNGIGVKHALNVRIPRIIDAATSIIAQQRAAGRIINTAHVCYGGDMIEGCYIYAGQNVTGLDRTDKSHRLIRQIAMASAVEATITQSIAAIVPEVKHRSVPGNHGRPNGKNDFSDPEDNFDTLVSEWSEDKLTEQTNVEFFHEEHWWHGFESMGRQIVMQHGDKWRGDVSKIRTLLPAWVMGGMFKPDVLLTFHRHEFDWFNVNGCEVIQNGTLDGGSGWYTRAYGRSAPPSQAVVVMSREHGVESVWPIRFPEQSKPALENPLG